MLIVGAGVAGLCAAIVAARSGMDVRVLEKNEKAGRKILVSGNGRCNIGNSMVSARRYNSSSSQSIVSEFLSGVDHDSLMKFFTSLGLEIVEESEGRLYPMSGKSSCVTELLLSECERLGVDIIYESRCEKVVHDGSSFRLYTERESFEDTTLLLSTGSPAAPHLGGEDGGMLFASSLGHTAEPFFPALVPLECDGCWDRGVSGVKLIADVTLRANGRKVSTVRGDILFTDYGISGLAILDISIEVSRRISLWEYCELELNLLPDFGKERLVSMMLKRVDRDRNLPIGKWLCGILHPKIADLVLRRSSLSIERESSLDRKTVTTLVYEIEHLKFPVSSTRSFRYAEVALGGVSIDEVDPCTMESRIVPGLYFAGEILDIVGDRGGYNFHFAWISAIKAARAVISSRGL